MDGSESHEAVLTLLAIDKLGADYLVMAPNIDQHHTINHYTGIETREARNVLVESARIARGNIKDIKDVDINDLDAVIIPGGFGVAKNLSDFAFKGRDGEIIDGLFKLIISALDKKIPIGAICITPAVLSLILGKKGVEVTIGNDKVTAEVIESCGGRHIEKKVNEIYYDKLLNVVSTPAYMYEGAKLHDVYEGIEKLVKKIIDLI